ncbi:MAG TPA: hypothetical protein VN605_11055 [Thermoanaerobaculia bacterium]|nr:hypothetical protein [Thermoanaerobaculia bacterium]
MLHFPRAIRLLFVLPLTFCARQEPVAPAAPQASAATAPAPAAPAAAPVATTSSVATASAAAAPTPAPPAGGIATAEGETAGVTAVVKELKRASGDIVSLKLVITNGSGKQISTGYEFGDPDKAIADFGSIGGVQLIDPVGRKKYFVARDADGKCICSRGLKDIAAGASINTWAKFPAPPADVQKISIVIPHFSPMDDVPIGQ